MKSRIGWISSIALALLILAPFPPVLAADLLDRCREDAGFTADGRVMLAVGVNEAGSCKQAASAHPNHADVYAYWARIEYRRNNFTEADVLLKRAESLGSDLALVLRGIMAEFGMGRNADAVFAAAMYRKAAERGQRFGMHKLGEVLINGKGGKRDVEQGEAWLAKSAMQDQIEVRYWTALAYIDGAKAGDTDEKARKLIEDLDRRGFMDAGSTLAWMHMAGRGTPKNEAKAIAIYERVAEKGNLEAQMIVAHAYLNGRGVERDPDKAARWYAAAAGRGSKDAAMMLGWFHQVHTKRIELVRKWYLEAARLGAVQAYAELAFAYGRGVVVAPNPVEAHRYLLEGAKLGDPTAQYYLAYQFLRGEGIDKDAAAARQWATRAAEAFTRKGEAGGAGAMYMLAMLYREGLGVPSDERKAAELIEKSAELGYLPAQLWMTHMLIHGSGVTQDLQRAMVSFDRAAQHGATPEQLIQELNDITEQAVETGANVRQWLNPTVRKVVTQYRAPGQKLGETELDRLYEIAAAQQALGDVPLMNFLLDNLAVLVNRDLGPSRHADLASITYLKAWALGITGGDTGEVRRTVAMANRMAEQVSESAIDSDDQAMRVGLGAMYGFVLAGMLEEAPAPALRRMLDYAEARLSPELNKRLLAFKSNTGDPWKLLWHTKQMYEDIQKETSLGAIFGAHLDLLTLLMSEKDGIDSFSITDTNAPRFQRAALKLQASPDALDSYRSIVFYELAKWHDAHGRTGPAIYYGKLAVAAFDSGRAGFTKEEAALERKYLDSRGDAYRHVAAMLARAGRFAESELILRVLRFDELSKTGNHVRAGDQGFDIGSGCHGEECTVFQQQKNISAQYLAATAKLQQLSSSSAAAPGQADAVRTEMQRLENAWAESVAPLMAKAQSQDGPLASRTLVEAKNKALKVYAALAQSRRHYVTIRYLVLPDQLVAIVSTNAPTPIVIETKTKWDELKGMIGQFRAAIQAKDPDVKTPAARLYDVLLKPVAHLLGPDARGQRPLLMISPDRGLKLVPFTALYDGKEWVTQKWPVAYFTDATLDNLGKPPETLSAQAFGTTGPVPDKALVALTHVQEEMDIVGAKFGKDAVHMNDAFTRESLYAAFHRNSQLLDKTAVVHVATHFLINLRRPQDSQLIVGKGAPVTQGDIEAWSVINTGLLLLSACNTGVSVDVEQGTTADDFSSKAQMGGAHAVMATLWEVNDKSTSRLVREFYQHRYGATILVDKATALQLAQQTVLSNKAWEHPYYWAPFVIHGNWR